MLHTHRSIWKPLFSLLLALLWATISVTPSFADVAPPPWPQGYTILPGDEQTQVRMMYENVFMNIDLNGVAKVDANFVMRNLGGKEERMDVYFPLYNFEPHIKINDCTERHLSDDPITDLAAWVWDQPESIKTDYVQQPNYMAKPGESLTMDVPCWGIFTVVFPPGLDVPIEVKYTSPSYSYILTTGAGWNGTIGQADVTFRLPYEVIQDQNFEDCFPKICTLSGRDIQWKFQDFEPKENVGISVAYPSVWWQILTETNDLKLNPNNTSILQKLAVAYKKSVFWNHAGRGIQSGEANVWRYKMSLDTFRKAINMSPGDVDLHAQYADLICQNALWNSTDLEYAELVECVRQIKQALDIDPKNKMALDNLGYLKYNMARLNLVNLDGPKPDYLILTPTIPTPTSIYWQTPFSARGTPVEPTQPPATRTPAATITPSPNIYPSSTPAFTLTPLTTPTPMPAPEEKEAGSVWLWAIVPLAAILAFAVSRKRGDRG